MRVFIIAEAGVNHNGSIDLAKKLIDVASNAGADAVKFQTFNYIFQHNLKYTSKKTLDFTKSLQLGFNEFKILKEFSDKHNIEFLSTPFDQISAKFLNKIGVKYFKIASPSIVDIPLLKCISKFKKKFFLSIGMSNYSEISKALNILGKKNTIILYCVSLYPTPYNKVDLNIY